jgi:hypothetical protein
VLSFMLSAWLPWIAAFALLVVLPVLLRLYAGDELDNAITQEQPGDDDGEREPDAFRAAA